MFILKFLNFLLVIYFIINLYKDILFYIKNKRVSNLIASFKSELHDATNEGILLNDTQKEYFNQKLSCLLNETNESLKNFK
jgi:hypothetical protein